MRATENLSPFVAAGLGMTLAILVIFQLYLQREPQRIEADMTRDLAAEVEAGQALYAENCSSCHGANGEGLLGPALNSQQLLKSTLDEALFSLIRTGIPGTMMPAWAQAFGGPFTDQEVSQMVAFMRSWEPTAPLIEQQVEAPDPANGARIFAGTCFICHGTNGEGTEGAPAINDPQRLQQFDDDWYGATIAEGRPARGMPTWGTVLSPEQIDDLVALIAAWREGQTVVAPMPSEPQEGQPPAGSVAKGEKLFAASCAPCHAADGTGGAGPNLHSNALIQSKDDAELVDFLLTGVEGTAMTSFQGRLDQTQLNHIVTLLRSWQR